MFGGYIINPKVLHLSELTKLSNEFGEKYGYTFVLHLSELTKLSNAVMIALIVLLVLHLSELTKLSNVYQSFISFI